MSSLSVVGDKIRLRYVQHGTKHTHPDRWPDSPEGRVRAKEAQKKLDRWLDQELPVAPGAVLSTQELGDRWEAAKLEEKKSYAKVNRRRWDHHCRENGWTTVAQITAESVKAWKKRKSPVGAIRTVHAILEWSQGECGQIIPLAILKLLRLGARARRQYQLMEDDQARAIQAGADADGPQAGAMVYLYQAYGWRPATMGRLLVGHVDLEDQTVLTLNKNPKGPPIEKVIPMDEELLKRLPSLVAGRKPDEPLFIHPLTGAAFSDEQGNGQRACVWLKRHLGAGYDNKRLGITRMDEAGLSNAEIKTLTGHEGETIIDRYKKSNLTKARGVLAKLGRGGSPTSPVPSPAGLGLVRNDRSDTMSSDDDGENYGKILHFPMRRAT